MDSTIREAHVCTKPLTGSSWVLVDRRAFQSGNPSNHRIRPFSELPAIQDLSAFKPQTPTQFALGCSHARASLWIQGRGDT